MNTSKSIRQQIFSGYRVMIILLAVMALSTFVCMTSVLVGFANLTRDKENHIAAQTVISSHYSWLDQLSDSIMNGTPFTGSQDHTSCSLGQWIVKVQSSDIPDPAISAAITAVQKPHQAIHSSAGALLNLAQTNRLEAYNRYSTEIRPQVAEVIAQLNVITEAYKNVEDRTSAALGFAIVTSIVLSIVLAICGIVIGLWFGKRAARRISDPIKAVAEWSELLAAGHDHIDYDDAIVRANRGNEIGDMIDAFQRMTQSIHEQVELIRRLAQGDMDVEVQLRSDQDALGLNLSHMVQSTNHALVQVREVALNVSKGAKEIASASASLADSSSNQASAVQELFSNSENANNITIQNTEVVEKAVGLASATKQAVDESNEKMSHVVSAVEGITHSFDQISGIINMIEDIAFQTNILALNAAIEAARAGNAGKGFAVVADEVRQLALRSSEAVNESNRLIAQAQQESRRGSQITHETFTNFQSIVNSLDEITDVISTISHGSNEQLRMIGEIKHQTELINEEISANAAASEEMAATSNSISEGADQLNAEIGRFRLQINPLSATTPSM